MNWIWPDRYLMKVTVSPTKLTNSTSSDEQDDLCDEHAMEPNTWKSFIIDDTRRSLLGIICEDICYKNLIEVVLEERGTYTFPLIESSKVVTSTHDLLAESSNALEMFIKPYKITVYMEDHYCKYFKCIEPDRKAYNVVVHTLAKDRSVSHFEVMNLIKEKEE
ncbi:hypothetical protein YC2023_017131 [Brassica napus]